MGNSFNLVCKGCGYTIFLSIGLGFESYPDNPRTKERILNGEYGARPKKVLEENPGARYSWYDACFECTCGNYASKSTVFIVDKGRALYRPSKRCNLCHRKMREVRGLEHPPYCPKCGARMRMDHEILWD